MMGKRKRMKPSDYPDLILKALYQRYRQLGETKIETSELQQLSGVPNDGLYNALEILEKRGRIEEGGSRGETVLFIHFQRWSS